MSIESSVSFTMISTKRVFLVRASFDDNLSFLQTRLDELFDFDQREHNVRVIMIEGLLDDLQKAVNLFPHRTYPEAVVSIMNDIMGRALLIATNIVRCTQKNFPHKNDVCAICLEEEAQQPIYCLQCLKVVGCKDCMNQLIEHSHQFLKCLRCQRNNSVTFPFFFYANLSSKTTE